MSRRMVVLLSLQCLCLPALADTYRCVKGGQAVFSDTPCAAGVSRVDQGTDNVSRDQRRQAEFVNLRNRSQLSELEYRAARDRNTAGNVLILPGEAVSTPSTTSRRSR